jgi:hypothetical protein
MDVSYKYSEKLSVLKKIKDMLEGLAWTNGEVLTKDQITLYYKSPNSDISKKPFVCLTIENNDWVNLIPIVIEKGTGFDIIKDGEFSGKLKFKIYAENPVQRELIESAIRRLFCDTSGRGTPTVFIKNDLYINNRVYEIKLVLKRYMDNDSERNAVNNIYEGTVEGDIQFPILRIVSTVLMLPEYDLTFL